MPTQQDMQTAALMIGNLPSFRRRLNTQIDRFNAAVTRYGEADPRVAAVQLLVQRAAVKFDQLNNLAARLWNEAFDRGLVTEPNPPLDTDGPSGLGGFWRIIGSCVAIAAGVALGFLAAGAGLTIIGLILAIGSLVGTSIGALTLILDQLNEAGIIGTPPPTVQRVIESGTGLLVVAGILLFLFWRRK